MKFEIKLTYPSYQAVLLHDQKVDKNMNILRMKRAFEVK